MFWQTSLVAQTVMHLPTMQETRVRSLGWEDPLEKEMEIHSSTIAWKIPWTEEPGRLQSTGSQRVGHDRVKWVSYILSESLLFNWISVFVVYLFPSFCCKLICVIFEVSVQFSSVAHSCPTLCNPMNCSIPGLPVHHQLQEFTQTHVHRVSDAIQPSHPWSSPSPPAPNPSQHQSVFQWVYSSHEVAKVLEFQL